MKLKILIRIGVGILLISFIIVFFKIPIVKDIEQKYNHYRIKEALKDNPYSAELHYKLAQHYLYQGNLNEYENELLIARRIDDSAYLYPEKLADHYFKIGKYEEAINYYNEVLKLDEGGDLLIYFKIGNSYNNMGEKQLAIKYYKKQIEWLKMNNNAKNKKMLEFINKLVSSLEEHFPKN